MVTRHIEGHGLVLDGHGYASPDEAIDAATAWYGERGEEGFTLAREAAVARAGVRVDQVWYCDEYGFVQCHHDQAEPVTVVGMFMSESVD